MIVLYRLLCAPALFFGFFFAAFFSKKIKAGLKLRQQPLPQQRPQSRPVWIHASSGEFEYAKSLIRTLKQNQPTTLILVTYFSPTYRKNIESFPGVDFSCALPLDLPGPLARFLDFYQPQICLIARTDLWPEMLVQTKQRGIPRVLFSATQKPVGFLRRVLKRLVLNQLSHIYCVSGEDQKVLARITTTPTEVIGDTRYDQAIFRKEHPKAIRSARDSQTPILVAGSTWPQDERILLEAAAPILASGQLRLILVPHEPTPSHLAELSDHMTRLQLPFALYSQFTGSSGASVVLVDTVGVLAELYLQGDLAFVGGSFKGSVHSVMEPLAAGLPTVVGPYCENNREAQEFRGVALSGTSYAMVTVVHEAGTLRTWIIDILKAPKSQPSIENAVKNKAGATDQLFRRLTAPASYQMTHE